ncbi:MAG: tRNA (adenosine(37)-N6)-dimethylallyltransferase MiaA [Candidatus Paceibacterota bacterium]|jgi:tRNA dimethylallyltransferase
MLKQDRVQKHKLIATLGQTATGKSDMAVRLAKKFNGEIISADSRQVYKGLDTGTGKITKREMQGVPHHLLDVANPKKRFSVSLYKKLAEKAVADIHKRRKVSIICGGTGLYIDAVVNGIILPAVEPNLKLRKQLEKKTVKQLFEMLKKLDPGRAKTIDAQNPRRLIRAIEIARAIGESPNLAVKPPSWDTLKIGLKLPDKELRRKIHIRLLLRMKQGMAAEVRRLNKNGVSWKRLEAFGLEYKYIALYLQKKITKDEMLTKLETEIWRYAKRQNTWFKRDKEVKWFDPVEFKKIEKAVKRFLI